MRILYLACFIFLAVQLSSFSQNVEYEFEDDRDVQTIGNVRHIESRSVYTTRHLEQLKQEVDVLKKAVNELQEAGGANAKKPTDVKRAIDTLAETVSDLEKRVDELYASQDEIIASQNQLIANVEELLNSDILKRVEKLEKASKAESPQEETNS